MGLQKKMATETEEVIDSKDCKSQLCIIILLGEECTIRTIICVPLCFDDRKSIGERLYPKENCLPRPRGLVTRELKNKNQDSLLRSASSVGVAYFIL